MQKWDGSAQRRSTTDQPPVQFYNAPTAASRTGEIATIFGTAVAWHSNRTTTRLP